MLSKPNRVCEKYYLECYVQGYKNNIYFLFFCCGFILNFQMATMPITINIAAILPNVAPSITPIFASPESVGSQPERRDKILYNIYWIYNKII